MQAEVEKYIRSCSRLGVTPDGGLICALKAKSTILKPLIKYNEGQFYSLLELFVSISRNPALKFPFQTLYFDGGHIGSNGILLLAEFLRKDTSISSISIVNNQVGPRGIYALSDLFENGDNKTLHHLNLHGNRIYPKGALALAKALSLEKHALRSLDISNNHIGFKSFLELRFVCMKQTKDLTLEASSNFIIEEIWNTISHGAGFFLSMLATAVTIFYAKDLGAKKLLASMIYCSSLVCCFLCSTLYHSFFKLGSTKAIFQRLDHAAIFMLIAGTYTPMLLGGPLDGFYGTIFLMFVWFLGTLGIVLTCTAFNEYPVLELTLYLAMGWVSLAIAPVVYFNWEDFASGAVLHINGLLWYALGGVLYTTGVYFFVKGTKIPIYHAVWHVFVIFASFCHFAGFFLYVLPTPSPAVPYW